MTEETQDQPTLDEACDRAQDILGFMQAQVHALGEDYRSAAAVMRHMMADTWRVMEPWLRNTLDVWESLSPEARDTMPHAYHEHFAAVKQMLATAPAE